MEAVGVEEEGGCDCGGVGCEALSDLTPARARPKSGLEMFGLGLEVDEEEDGVDVLEGGTEVSFVSGLEVEEEGVGASMGLLSDGSVDRPPILESRLATGGSAELSF